MLDGDGSRHSFSLKLDGKPLPADAYMATPDNLTIAQPPHRPFTLEIETVVDPAANTQLMGLYRSGDTYCTQCEAEGFRRITYFLDRPDVMAVYTTRIEADKARAPVLLANGNLIDARRCARHRPAFRRLARSVPQAVLSVRAGRRRSRLASTTVSRTMSGRNVALGIYVEPGKEDRCRYAMDALKRAMRWDEEAFGREYDLDMFMIVAVSDFNMGAMENKGLNIFNDKYVLAKPETATDADYASIEAVIAHEYFHNWTGDRITCRDWFQLCLKEGLTVFRDQEFSSDMRSRAVKRIDDVRALRAHNSSRMPGPLAHPVRPELYKEINNFYTTHRLREGRRGRAHAQDAARRRAFRNGMDLYFERHDGEAATVEQFVAMLRRRPSRDLTQFMRWYTPGRHAGDRGRAAPRRARQDLRLDITQTVPPTPGQPDKQPMVIPLAFGLVGQRPRPAARRSPTSAIERGVLELTEARREFRLQRHRRTARAVAQPRLFGADQADAADLHSDDLRFLAAHDSDPFNRWQAVQTLAMSLLTANVTALRSGGRARRRRLRRRASRHPRRRALEPAFVALALTLPSEPDVAREIGHDVDPDAIFAARKHCGGDRRHAGSSARRHPPAHDNGGSLSPGCRERRAAGTEKCLSHLLAASGDQRRRAAGAGAVS